jgi:hypothetical protein
VVRLTSPDAVPGWASTILPIYFLGGVQLFCLGVIGEYIGKIYVEAKKRPRFLVERLERGHRSERDVALRPRSRLQRSVTTGSRSRAAALVSRA